MFEVIDPIALNGTTADYNKSTSSDLLDRWTPHFKWHQVRAEFHVDPYSKFTSSRIAPELTAHDRWGRKLEGVNFASQDYLSLASHPAVIAVAQETAGRLGVHSAGSSVLMGLTELTVRLENEIANFMGLKFGTIFPTGWAAGYGLIKTLVRPDDHVIIDVLAHACLQEGARNATKNIHTFPHLSNEAVERRLKSIRSKDAHAGILVVTETLFSMNSDVPEISPLQALCHQYGATLMVDVAHDLGCIASNGRGFLEWQDMLGKVDVVMGSFSKTFASNGGFVATNHPALQLALRYYCGPQTFSNTLSPIQAAVVLECIKVIQSPEGLARRQRLMSNISYMRTRFIENGFELLGQPSAIIPVLLGETARTRLATRFALESGGLVNSVEYPAVARNDNRWRCQVMTDHTEGHIDRFIAIAAEARAKADEWIAQTGRGDA
jgi:glycine C-acetyltransferase